MTQYAATTTADRAVSTNRVLKNTYLLLAMTLAFSAAMAFVALAVGAPVVSWWIMMAVFIGMPFGIGALRNSIWSIPLTFAFTGIMGFFMGPIVGLYLQLPGGEMIVTNALAGTAFIFLSLSAYALVSKKDFSFMGGFLFVGLLVAIVAIVANIFLQIPALSLGISAAVVLLMSALILYDTSRMVHNGETNYVLMTVSLFANIYVLFSHLLNLFAMLSGDD